MSEQAQQTNPIGWFEIYTDDLQRAKKFYEAVFQVTLSPLPSPVEGIQMLAFPSEMTRYGAAGALAHMKKAPAGVGGTLVYFSCEDCAVEAGRVADAGGKVMIEKFSIGEYGFICMVMDTEGNMIGMHSMK